MVGLSGPEIRSSSHVVQKLCTWLAGLLTALTMLLWGLLLLLLFVAPHGGDRRLGIGLFVLLLGLPFLASILTLQRYIPFSASSQLRESDTLPV